MKSSLGRIGKGLLIGIPVGIIVYIVVVALKALTEIFLPLVATLLPGASPVIQTMVSFFLMVLLIGAIGCFIEFLHPVQRIKRILLKMPPLRRNSNQKEVPEAFQEKRIVSVRLGDISLFGILIGELSVNNDNGKPEKKVKVFVPNSPVPFTGFVLIVSPEKVSFMRNFSVSQFLTFESTYGVKGPVDVLKETEFEKASLP